MMEILIRNKRTTLIGVLSIALFILFWIERITVNEVIALLTALNAIGFFLSKDGATAKEHCEEAKQYRDELKDSN
jgi:hypothetical protein